MERVSKLASHVQPAGAAADLPPGGGWGQKYDFYNPPTPLYNTVKRESPQQPRRRERRSPRGCRSAEKLLDGEKVFGFAMEKLDVELYLEARKHYDYIWFEMQHATLTYADGTLQRLFLCAVRLLPKPQRSRFAAVEAMIKAGSISDAETGESNAIPLVRMHSPATEHGKCSRSLCVFSRSLKKRLHSLPAVLGHRRAHLCRADGGHGSAGAGGCEVGAVPTRRAALHRRRPARPRLGQRLRQHIQ